MGIIDNIKDFYFGLEDGYYHLLDSLDNRGIPVYAVVDPIDKFIPSFGIVFVLILALLIGGVFWLSGAIAPSLTLTATFTDSQGNPLPQLPVQVQSGGQTLDKKTGNDGKIILNVSPNSQVGFTVSVSEFAPLQTTVQIQGESVSKTFLLSSMEQAKTKTIQFVDQSGFAVNQKISLSVACSQPGIAPNETQMQTDQLGKITLSEPVGCGNLQVTVLGPSEFKTKNYSLDQPFNTLRLEGIGTVPDAPEQMQPIRIRIQDDRGDLVAGINLEVSLYKENVFQKKTTTNTGKARFEDLQAGTYSVSVSDPSHTYAGQPVAGIIVSQSLPAGETTVTLTQNIQMQISAQAFDADTLSPIPNATIIFRNSATGIELYRGQTGSLGNAVDFSGTEQISLKIEAYADGYFSNSMITSQTGGQVSISLSKTTVNQPGSVKVRIVDESGKPVSNARVFLRDADTQTIGPFPEQTSDLNGMAAFTGVTAGDWYAYAEKYPAQGSSPKQTYDPSVEGRFDITMEIGNTELTINAFSEHNELIPNSIAELRTSDNQLVGEIPLPSGTATFQTKADKRLFIIVKNPQYFSYQTETFQLYKDNSRTINAILPSRLLGGGPKAVFLGVFDEADKPVTKLQAGQTYFVRMQLQVPENSDWQKAGIHFRVGASKTIENDSLLISGVNVGNASLVAGTTFNEPKGNLVDLSPKNLSKGDAKWAEFSWTRPQPRAYNAVIKIFVKKNAIPNSAMPIYYRAWAEQKNGSVLRDPIDNELGNAYNNDKKQGLYANSHAIVSYFEGADAECIDNFCFSNLRVLDIRDGLFLKTDAAVPFDLRINSPYTLSFILSNNSESNYTGAKITIRSLKNGVESSELKFTNYSVSNASQQVFSNASPLDSIIKDIDAGEFKPNTGIQAKVDFTPTTLNSNQIEITVVFENQIVVSKIIDFDTSTDKRMKIELDPNFIGPFSPTPIVAHITVDDNESETNGMDLENALVTLTIETPDHAKTGQQQLTNPLGKVTFNLPSLLPATKLKFKAEKPDYFSDPVTLAVDSNIIYFVPEQLVSNLKTSVQTEEILSVDAINKLNLDLTVTRIKLHGNFKGVLDETQMDNYLQQIKGHVFKAGQTENIAILKTSLADIPIYQNQKLDAALEIEVQNPAINERIPLTIPVTINVALTGLPENQTCLTVDETSWSGSVQDNRIMHTFSLTNNCTVEGKPIVLSNLAARLKWNSEMVGNVELSLTQANGGNSANTNTLLPGDSTVFFDKSKTSDTYYGELSFTPKSGKLGKTAKFDVDFIASASTDSGPKNVSSDIIKADILIVNLENCLTYSTSSTAGLSNTNNSNSNTTSSSGFGGQTPVSIPFSGGTNNPLGTGIQPAATNKTELPIVHFAGKTAENYDSKQNNYFESADKFNPINSTTGLTKAFFQSDSSDTSTVTNSNTTADTTSATSGVDASEVYVKIPYKGEGTLTIDSSACGPIDLEVALCLDDSGCSGGAEGSINLNTDNFTLTTDHQTKTLHITGMDIAGIYGLTVWLRPPGRDYQIVGLIDVIVDPNPQYYFSLDKYEYFIKGNGAKDTGTITNKNFSSVTVVDAPAQAFANLKEPKDDGGFGNMMPLMAAGLIPAMLGPLTDALQGSKDEAQAAGDKKFGDFKDGQDATKDAEKAAKDLAGQCDAKNGDACKDMTKLQDALKKTDELVNGKAPPNQPSAPKTGGLITTDFKTKQDAFIAACKNPASGPADPKMTIVQNTLDKGVDNCGGLETSVKGIGTEFNNAQKNFGDLTGDNAQICGNPPNFTPVQPSTPGAAPPAPTGPTPSVPPTNPTSPATDQPVEQMKQNKVESLEDGSHPSDGRTKKNILSPQYAGNETVKPDLTPSELDSIYAQKLAQDEYVPQRSLTDMQNLFPNGTTAMRDSEKVNNYNLVGPLGENPNYNYGQAVPVLNSTGMIDGYKFQPSDSYLGKYVVQDQVQQSGYEIIPEKSYWYDNENGEWTAVAKDTSSGQAYLYSNLTQPAPAWLNPADNQYYTQFGMDNKFNNGQPGTLFGPEGGRIYRYLDNSAHVAIPYGKSWIVSDVPTKASTNGSSSDPYYFLPDPTNVKGGTYVKQYPVLFGWLGNRYDQWNPDSQSWVTIQQPSGFNVNKYQLPFVPGSTTAHSASETKIATPVTAYFQAPPASAPPATALSSFNMMCSQYRDVGTSATNASAGMEAARKQGQWANPKEVNAATKRAASTIETQAVPNQQLASASVGKGDAELEKAKGKLNEVKKNFDDLAKKRDCADATVQALPAKIALISDPAKRTACNTAFADFKTEYDKKIGTNGKLDEAIKEGPESVDKTLAKVNDTDLKKTVPDLSKTSAEKTKTAQDKANKAKDSMNEVSNATPQLSKDNGGANSNAFGNALAQAAQMGLMMAAMDSMFNPDGTDEQAPQNQPHVQSQMQVFNIDLSRDGKGIDMDNPGIGAAYDPKTIKSFGDMKTQTAGVVFENKEVTSDRPVYSTGNFKATEHRFNPITYLPINLPLGQFGGGWMMDIFGQSSDYSQKFHLKFLTSDAVQRLPLVQSETFSCTQGAMVGRTGAQALPKVKLSWKFADISESMCDAKNADYKYCDATQFTITILERMKNLDDFLKANPGLSCPTNPMEEQLNQVTDPISQLSGRSFSAASHVTECWLPHSTELYDGYPSLSYFVQDASSVHWTDKIKSLQDLQDTISFDAYLIQDGYTEDFLKDFSQYYTNINFGDTPAYFNQDSQGKNYNKYFKDGLLVFRQKFSDSVQLPTSGLYRVDLTVKYGPNWDLFDSTGTPIGSVRVDLLAARQTPFNSPFYFLPFDGLVGIEASQLNRQGYGTGFDVNPQDAFSISRNSAIQTLAGQFSNPIQTATVSRTGSLEELNSRPSNRGFILEITSTGLTSKQIRFTPTIATPVLLKISQPITEKKFSAFYSVLENQIPTTTGNSLSFWTGAGTCRDFSGDSVVSAFEEKPDRKTTQSDRLEAWQFSYALDWSKAVIGGDEYLKTVFYTPTNSAFALNTQSGNVVFSTADQTGLPAVDLQGIQNMPFNRKGQTETDRITALDDLFSLVENGQVCVTNTGSRTAFWWNPKTIYDQVGNTGASISQVEQALASGSTCLG
ncbi:MAG: carboxypeptidase-like regulatory domain-containing protein [Candidatus Micrarchaeota archaeon]